MEFLSCTSLQVLPHRPMQPRRSMQLRAPQEAHFSVTEDKEACSADCHTCAFLLTTKPEFSKSLSQNFHSSVRKMKIDVEEILDGTKPFPFIGNRKLIIQVQRKDPVLLKLCENLRETLLILKYSSE